MFFYYPPMTYPAWLTDYYFYITWFFSLLFFSIGWAIFYRYGKFSYAVNLGCFWKTVVMVVLTTVSLGVPNYLNIKFDGEHGQEGESIELSVDKLVWHDHNGSEKKQLDLNTITSVYQETITLNQYAPPKIFIVAAKPPLRDSLFVTTNLKDYQSFLSELSKRTGVEARLNIR